MYERILQLSDYTRKSFFLLGPRQTGKSTLIRQQLPNAPIFNLLDSGIYRRLSADPSHLRREVSAMPNTSPIVIDEVQLLPELLNEVHLLIEEQKRTFILTGSSARALRKKGINLLGGRAGWFHLHPLVFPELRADFDLSKAINRGLLPAIYQSDDANRDMEDYVGLYLKEEVAAEGLTRNLSSFSRFLEVAALSNGSIINLTKIASDAEVKRTTVADWFQILRDTMIAYDLPAWTKSKTRKAITSSKFYFFDVGVARFLSGQKFIERTNPWFGIGLENLIFHELRALIDYKRAESLEYWRSTSGFEVDFLLDQRVAIEVKSSTRISKDDLRGLNAINEENKNLKRLLVYLGSEALNWDGVEILPLSIFLEKIWAAEI